VINRLPVWFKQEIPENIGSVRNRLRLFENLGLYTVCRSACCPNVSGCFKNNHVTFMIMGPNCSRHCAFCAVAKGVPVPLNSSEAYKVALSLRGLNLKYAVITSTTRDDLPSGGATQFTRVTYLVRTLNPGIKIELLIPDFKGSLAALGLVVRSSPDVIAHNLETVRRLYPEVRPQGNYHLALSIFKKIRKLGFAHLTKSGIMLGLGETEDEVIKTMRDLRSAGCDIFTLGQYLAPSAEHFPVKEFVCPEKFDFYRRKALSLGFKAVSAGPLVRSSYQAEETYSNSLHQTDK